MLKNIYVIISNIVEVCNAPSDLLDFCKEKLIFKNPEYSKKVQLGYWVGATPKTIKLYDYDGYNERLYIPIGCLDDVRTILKKYDNVEYQDYRGINKKEIKSHIELRDYQKPCIQAIDKYKNGVLLIPCGMGKTECALAIASHLGQKTLFIAHTKDLINQASERCKDELDCKYSFITDGKVDLSGDVVFATVQTLCKKLDKIPQNEFGYVVCDEVHHLAASAQTVGMFRECLDYFSSQYKLGLTATLHRADGLEVCIPRLLGEVMYEIRQDGNDYVGIFEGTEILRFPKDEYQVPVKINFIETDYSISDENGNYRDVFDRNGMTINFSKLLTDISNDYMRNKKIIDLCNSLKGSTIILSDRVDQLKHLANRIESCVEIDGSTPKKIREQALEDVKSGKVKVLLASYKLAKEGLDCKILENIILATPIKDEAIVVQCIGRIQRPYDGKEIANVYDLIDNVSTLTRFYKKRKSIYSKKGWL